MEIFWFPYKREKNKFWFLFFKKKKKHRSSWVIPGLDPKNLVKQGCPHPVLEYPNGLVNTRTKWVESGIHCPMGMVIPKCTTP